MRRLTYVLASGAVVVGAAAWAVQQPFVDRWIVGKLDALIRDETGLTFQADRLEIAPFKGRVTLRHVALGGDLLRAQTVEVEADLASLWRLPHIRRILVDHPEVNLDARRLSAIHLKQHPPRRTPAPWRVDRVDVVDGQASVDEPAWGIRRGSFRFTVDGRGRLPNQLWLDVRVPQASLGTEPDRLSGGLSLKFRFTGSGIDTANLQAHLGQSSVKVLGALDLDASKVKAEVTGGADLAEVLGQVPGSRPRAAAGYVEFKGGVQGPLAAPAWNLALEGRGLRAAGAPLAPGTLTAAASGAPGRLRVERLAWESPDGKVQAQGTWTRQEGTVLDLDAQGVSLAPAAAYARVEFLKGLTGRFHGTASLPGLPWAAPDLEKARLQGTTHLFKDGQEVGSVDLRLEDRRLRADALAIHVPELEFEGDGQATLDRKGPASIEAQGEVGTDAAHVAQVLRAWKVTDLDMGGAVRARATLRWNRPEGLVLEGEAAVDGPRWHHAHADHVDAKVHLTDSDIRITEIELAKGPGHGWGDIWISWAKGAPADAEGIDMCFRAWRLPIHEGLAAADQQDLAIEGTGSGWARLHGPLSRIQMEGQAIAEDATVYGLKIPAASGAFGMDIDALRLWTRNVRVADTMAGLSDGGGPLDLTGSMDLDAARERWTAKVEGRADTSLLGLPGPHLRGTVKGSLEGPLTAPLGPTQAPEGTFTLTDAELELKGQRLRDLQARLAFKDGRAQASAGFLNRPSPIVTFQALQLPGDRLAGDLALRLQPDTVDTAQLATQASQGFLKDLALDYRCRGELSKDGLAWTGAFQELRGDFEGFRVEQARPGNVKGDLQGVDLSAELALRTLSAGGAPSPSATSLSLEGRVPFRPQDPESLRLSGAAELGNLKAIVDHLVDPGQYSLMSDLRPSGTATFQLDVGGTPADPTLEGRLDLRDGRVAARTYPQSVENVDFTAYFHGRDITIPRERPLRGTLAQGTLAAWGRLTWGFQGLTEYDLGATLDDFQFRDVPEGFEIQGSLDGTLRGSDRNGGLLKGSIKAKQMTYQAEVSLTDIILAGAFGGGSGLMSLDPTDPLTRIELDLDLSLARPWDVETNLLKLQGNPNGTFKIMGTLAHPGLKGRMDLLPGGRLTNFFPAGDVVLERGSVTFTDPATFNPAIQLLGRVEVDPYLVTLDIGGTLDAITSHPTSTPSLRPDEIFIILMDPSAVSKVGQGGISTSQSAASAGLLNQGASLVTSLALARGLETLRRTLRLDRVNFAYAGTANMTLTLEETTDWLGPRIPFIATIKQEGPQTTLAGNLEFRFGNLVITLGAKQVNNSTSTPSETIYQGVQPSGEIRYTWSPR